MNREQDVRSACFVLCLSGKYPSTIFENRDGFAEDTSRSGAAECEDQIGLDHRQLLLEPLMASRDFHLTWRLMQTPLASRFEFEMLDGVRHVQAVTIQAGIFERAIEQLSS